MTTGEIHGGENPATGLGPTLMRAAWLAILLGLGFEVLLLLISVVGGSGTGTFVADSPSAIFSASVSERSLSGVEVPWALT